MGVNINMVHGDRDGLLVYILAYLNMAVGDYIKVYIESENPPVAEFSVTDAHFDANKNAKDIPFYISAEVMNAKFPKELAPQNKEFWFKVERVSGNGTEQSPPAPLFYKHPAPGEADIDGGKPFNQGLKLPIASESLVDQTVIDEGMSVTVKAYFNQALGDVVVLAFGKLKLQSTVTALGDVVFELTPDILATLVPTNRLLVRWEVFDVVENASGWSDALILVSKPGEVLLTAPIFGQADLENVVNHDGLAGGAMNVLVTGAFTVHDLIELTLEGLTKSGAPVTHTYSQTLTAAGRTVDFPVENERVRNLIGGSLHASYKLIRAGMPQNSKPADVTITGTSQPLGLLIVEPLVDNKLPVDTAVATVRVADYWPLKEGANVKVHWQTTDQNGIATLFIFQLLVTDPLQPVIFQVLAKYIAPYANSPLTVQCTVTNPGEVEVFSQLLKLAFGEAMPILRSPFLVAPAKNPIDSGLYPDGVTVRVEHLTAHDGDKARLEALNALPGTPPFATVILNKNKRANFMLSPTLLKEHQGRNLRLRWVLISNGLETPSPVLRLRILAPVTTLTFDDDPYSLGPAGRFTVRLTVATNDVGLPDETVKLTLPPSFTFSDNKGGSRDFVTDKAGTITVNGLKGHTVPGSYTLTALHGSQTVTAMATVRPQGSVGSIGIPYPFSIAISPDGNRTYVTSNSDTPKYGALSVVDTVSLKLIHTIAFRSAGTVVVSPDNSRVYVAGSLSDSGGYGLFVVDTASLEIIGSVPFIGFGGGGIALSPDGSHAYVCGGASPFTGFPNGRLLVVDTARYVALRTVVLQHNAYGVTVSPDGRYVYAVNAIGNGSHLSGTVSVIDTSTYGVVRHIEVGQNPHGIAVSPDSTRVYTVTMRDQWLVVIDASSKTVIRNVPIGIAAWALALSPDGRYLCASEWNKGKASVIVDTTDFSVRRISGGGTSVGVAISPDNRRAYVCNYTDNNVWVIGN